MYLCVKKNNTLCVLCIYVFAKIPIIMKSRIKIAQALQTTATHLPQPVTVMGWVRSFRNNQFIALNDGSCFGSLQIVVDTDKIGAETAKRLTAGAAISVDGQLVASQGKGQTVEVIAEKLEIFGDCPPEEYPLQLKNRPSLEYLREIAHLRFRTNTFGAIFRIRHSMAFAIHQFYHQRGFFCMHSPIITGSDAEGAGEMFRVTTLPMDKLPKTADGKVDFKKDFFGTSTHLTVSGQLEAELGALSLGQVYTFGPTFRAENSNTSRHLAEFWMIEPEVAFADLTDNMNLAEDMLKYVIQYALDHCREDLDFLNQRLAEEDKSKPVAERSDMSLLEKLQFCLKEPFERLTYTEAIEILKNSTPNKKGKFKYPIKAWGAD
ncbi:MAG: hypothetical protein RLZZ628_3862, partial [Bacteroidota bacterium]